MAVHAVDDGYSDVLCGNGNICGRNTTGPGICCKFDFTVGKQGQIKQRFIATNRQ